MKSSKELSMRMLFVSAVVITMAATTACSTNQPSEADSTNPVTTAEVDDPTAFKLQSSAFSKGQPIPAKHTADGEDVSPPLTWANVPEGTVSFVLICEDPDAPSPDYPDEDPWIHWVLFNVPGDVHSLSEGIPRDADLTSPITAKQGRNSWFSENVGYRGPEPPPGSGRHRYFFRLYALDTELTIESASANKETVVEAMHGHVIGETSLMGTFERNR